MARKIEIRLGNEVLITPGGLSTVGVLAGNTSLYENADKVPVTGTANPKIKNSDVVGAMLGLLSQAKTDYANVNEFREEPQYYCDMLGIEAIPSEEILRQRLDAIAKPLLPILERSNVELMMNAGIKPSSCHNSLVPLDLDVTPLDNSGSKKEGVSWTYKGHHGYAPMMAYLGAEGYNIGVEFREGSQHCQKGTPEFLRKTIQNAQKVTDAKLLVRMDSGNDSADNVVVCLDEDAEFIIKRNLRGETSTQWLGVALSGIADGTATVSYPRDGKEVYIGCIHEYMPKIDFEARIVYEVTRRTSTADGQCLLQPEIEAATYITSLFEPKTTNTAFNVATASNEEVIRLYHDHATCEQFHSEIKTDMDLERLPSGKFDTNAAIFQPMSTG